MNEFEKFINDRFINDHFYGNNTSLGKTPDGLYYNTVQHKTLPREWASVQMLWETWRAAIKSANASNGIAELEKQRDAAFKMSGCERGVEECCRNLANLDKRIAELESVVSAYTDAQKMNIVGCKNANNKQLATLITRFAADCLARDMTEKLVAKYAAEINSARNVEVKRKEVE